MTPEWADSDEGRRLAGRCPTPPLLVTASLFDEFCDADSPRGVLAVASPERSILSRCLDRAAGGPSPLIVYADGIQDPGNLGALARVAEGAAAAGLVTAPGSCRISHPRALRGSAGSLLRLPHASSVTVEDLDAALEERFPAAAPTWATLDPRGGQSIYEACWDGPFVLVVGAEGPGVSADAAARATLHLTIPMAGAVESLNATVSAAVVLFERARALKGTRARKT